MAARKFVRCESSSFRTSSDKSICIFELDKDGDVYYRHIEFQADADSKMAERCFRYNTQLTLQLEAPVLTTVIYLFPQDAAEKDLVFRLVVGGVEVNRWRFDVVRLWEVEASEALESE